MRNGGNRELNHKKTVSIVAVNFMKQLCISYKVFTLSCTLADFLICCFRYTDRYTIVCMLSMNLLPVSWLKRELNIFPNKRNKKKIIKKVQDNLQLNYFRSLSTKRRKFISFEYIKRLHTYLHTNKDERKNHQLPNKSFIFMSLFIYFVFFLLYIEKKRKILK